MQRVSTVSCMNGFEGGKQGPAPSLASDGRAHKRTQLNALGGPPIPKGEGKPAAPKGGGGKKRKRSDKKGSANLASQSISRQLDAIFGALLDGTETVREGAVEEREMLLREFAPEDQNILDWDECDEIQIPSEDQRRRLRNLDADAARVFESDSDEPDSSPDDPLHTSDEMDEEQSSDLLSGVKNSDEHNGGDTLMANADAKATIDPDLGCITAPAALCSTVAEGPTDVGDDVVNDRGADHGRVEDDDSREDQGLTYHDGLTDGIINELEAELNRAEVGTNGGASDTMDHHEIRYSLSNARHVRAFIKRKCLGDSYSRRRTGHGSAIGSGRIGGNVNAPASQFHRLPAYPPASGPPDDLSNIVLRNCVRKEDTRRMKRRMRGWVNRERVVV